MQVQCHQRLPNSQYDASSMKYIAEYHWYCWYGNFACVFQRILKAVSYFKPKTCQALIRVVWYALTVVDELSSPPTAASPQLEF